MDINEDLEHDRAHFIAAISGAERAIHLAKNGKHSAAADLLSEQPCPGCAALALFEIVGRLGTHDEVSLASIDLVSDLFDRTAGMNAASEVTVGAAQA